MIYITTAGAYPVGITGGLFIQVNAALTGTITVTSAGSTQYGTSAQTIAIVNNPTVGSQYRYGGLHTYGIITATTNADGNITVTPLARIV